MTKTACIFPGQGSQAVGMGKLFHDNFPVAREVFQEVDDALGLALSKIMFEGPEATLTETANAQPAIMATSIAILRVMEKEAGFSIKNSALVAGHSLGEYSALCAAGAFSLAATAALLRLRGEAMQRAVPLGEGGMSAILGLDLPAVELVVDEAGQGEVCEVANDNAPGQIVISGNIAAIARAGEIAKAKGAKRALPLPVSAPFHSSLMKPAAEEMAAAFAKNEAKAPAVPLLANVTADLVSDPGTIAELLVKQVTGRVRWRESVEKVGALGVTKLIEIGHGNVLAGLAKRINGDLTAVSINAPEAIDHYLKAA